MNKKASSILMILFELLAVALIVWTTTGVASAMGKSETTAKTIIAVDLKMMVDTLVSLPGEAVVEYPAKVNNYLFTLEQGSITVFQKNDPDTKKVTRTFILPKGYSASGYLVEKERLCLEKKSRTIFLRECKKEEK